jgi:uncharacterized protein DUF6069
MTVQVEAEVKRQVAVRTDLVVLALTVVAATGVWSLWTQVAGVDLVVRRGESTQTVGAAAVVLTVLVTAGLGLVLLRFLAARTRDGLRVWTIVASVVSVISLLGPLGATTMAAGLALASLHAVTALVLVAGLRQVRRPGQSAA